MGELFRRFWLPAMLPSELPKPDYPPVRLRLLGEDLVAFRDSNGEIGVVEAHCPHRGASLTSDATKSAASAASTTAGNLMSAATASTCLPNRPRATLKRRSTSRLIRQP